MSGHGLRKFGYYKSQIPNISQENLFKKGEKMLSMKVSERL